MGFYGILAPKGVSSEVLRKLNQTFKDTLESIEIQRKMLDQGAEPAYLDAEQFSQFLTKELPRWARVVQQAGAKIN